MLERQELRITPWLHRSVAQSESDGADRLHRIEAPDSGAWVGFTSVVRDSSWFGCGPRRLDVCETEDASLLMSIEQGWFGFGHWRIYDAEHCRIGGVIGRHVLDQLGYRLATIWQEGPALVVRTRGGVALAWLKMEHDGATFLRFADDLEANPFLRMVLLGACILSSMP